MKAIADTGFLVGLLHRDDQHHQWAAEVVHRLELPLLTCEAVLAETAFHLQSAHAVLEAVSLGLVRIAFDCHSNLTHLAELAQRYADRKPDLADLCLIRMSELHPKHYVVTVDESDFRVFRRNKREAIPLLCPPRK